MDIIKRITRDDVDLVTIHTELPVGMLSDQVADMFKRDLAQIEPGLLRGRVVRLSGRMLLAMGVTAGFFLRNAKAIDIDLWLEPQGKWYRAAGVHDSSPIRFPLDVGMIVRATVFGHETEVEIVSVSAGGRVQVQKDGQRAWIAESDVISFIGYSRRR
ncbi:MAG: hypothetical protein V2G41_09475 [bacterium JZ-2024 1]